MNKDLIQQQAVQTIEEHNGWGILEIATGVGKTKIIIDYIKNHPEFTNVLWIVPTVKLRDKTVKEEFEKWNAKNLYKDIINTICYRSITKLKDNKYDLVVMDEGHNITRNQSYFFWQNKYNK